ncbi:zinc finger protein 62 homolog [Cylas formicarius]|uniref:zinc finger protein 62 homolog n=1 Tax=Cylas formicarius TaxID=197179 RepID=UPI002958B89C|nr:zinc finger protein 62 homolog [Cylas formicarius]
MSDVVILVYRIVADAIVSVVKNEFRPHNGNKPVRTTIALTNKRFDSSTYVINGLNLSTPYFNSDASVVIEELKESSKEVDTEGHLNFPSLIRCQNCETNFPTKYQYQRHQCQFNIEKTVVRESADREGCESVNNKHDCGICGKRFVTKSNLERHVAAHENMTLNSCEHCKKSFISENRLRIHQENHCKKGGDISKFYRSDVTVWKCTKCHEVFSSLEIGTYHSSACSETVCFGQEYNVQSGNKHVEKILTEILLQCEFCNRTYSDKNLLLMHQRTHTTQKNYECVNCSRIFDSYVSASTHWLKKCSEFANLFYLPKLTFCEYCNRTFKSHEILYSHKIKKKHYTPKLHLSVNNGCQNKENINSANKCVDNKEIVIKLLEDVLKELEIPTEVADNNGGKIDNLTKMPLVEVKLEPTSETNSGNTTSEIHESKKGDRKRKNQRNLGKSNKKFSAAVDEGFKFQCEKCIKVFSRVADLEKHRSNEHAANFTCEECGQTLTSMKALLVHSRAHKSLKPYVCDTCGRSYSQTSHLWQHMRFHQGIKPFACPHEGCEARYTIRPDLKDHIRKVHTRERPFKCNVCNKCFLTGSVYYQHRLIHTNDRRYGCDICKKRFFRADALNNHRRIHTDERPYPCNVCGREFRQKGDRNKHARTQHFKVMHR